MASVVPLEQLLSEAREDVHRGDRFGKGVWRLILVSCISSVPHQRCRDADDGKGYKLEKGEVILKELVSALWHGSASVGACLGEKTVFLARNEGFDGESERAVRNALEGENGILTTRLAEKLEQVLAPFQGGILHRAHELTECRQVRKRMKLSDSLASCVKKEQVRVLTPRYIEELEKSAGQALASTLKPNLSREMETSLRLLKQACEKFRTSCLNLARAEPDYPRSVVFLPSESVRYVFDKAAVDLLVECFRLVGRQDFYDNYVKDRVKVGTELILTAHADSLLLCGVAANKETEFPTKDVVNVIMSQASCMLCEKFRDELLKGLDYTVAFHKVSNALRTGWGFLEGIHPHLLAEYVMEKVQQ